MRHDANRDVAAMAQAIGSGSSGQGRHSPLYRWLDARADAFGEMLETQRPAWRDIARWLTEQQITNAKGERLTPLLVQKTWQKVRRARADKLPRAAPKIQAAPCPVPAAPSSPPPLPVTPSPVEMADDDNRARTERLMRALNLRSGRNV